MIWPMSLAMSVTCIGVCIPGTCGTCMTVTCIASRVSSDPAEELDDESFVDCGGCWRIVTPEAADFAMI